MNFATCALCKEQGHNTSKCPELVDPLKPGFSGAGGGGGGGHDHDEDERLLVKRVEAATNPSLIIHAQGVETWQAPIRL
jgi:hypothetical protein